MMIAISVVASGPFFADATSLPTVLSSWAALVLAFLATVVAVAFVGMMVGGRRPHWSRSAIWLFLGVMLVVATFSNALQPLADGNLAITLVANCATVASQILLIVAIAEERGLRLTTTHLSILSMALVIAVLSACPVVQSFDTDGTLTKSVAQLLLGASGASLCLSAPAANSRAIRVLGYVQAALAAYLFARVITALCWSVQAEMYNLLFGTTAATLFELGLILVGVFSVINILETDSAPVPLVFRRQSYFEVAVTKIVDGSARPPIVIHVVDLTDGQGHTERLLEVARSITASTRGLDVALIRDPRHLIVVSTGRHRAASRVLARLRTTMRMSFTIGILDSESLSSRGEQELDLIKAP
ncbi:hypothetical protein [Microbacterium enclense]|nr:hypothetical protein [Microbacterium enclense]KSU54856.1 hypothetical protein AS029_07885 [Microbacterium enclense]